MWCLPWISILFLLLVSDEVLLFVLILLLLLLLFCRWWLCCRPRIPFMLYPEPDPTLGLGTGTGPGPGPIPVPDPGPEVGDRCSAVSCIEEVRLFPLPSLLLVELSVLAPNSWTLVELLPPVGVCVITDVARLVLLLIAVGPWCSLLAPVLLSRLSLVLWPCGIWWWCWCTCFAFSAALFRTILQRYQF